MLVPILRILFSASRNPALVLALYPFLRYRKRDLSHSRFLEIGLEREPGTVPSKVDGREFSDERQIQRFEDWRPHILSVAALAHGQGRIELVTTKRPAFEQAAIVGVIATDLVSCQ